MFSSVQSRRASSSVTPGVDVAPLIDVIFILLLFFLVTATFQPDAGIPIERPRAASAQALAGDALRILVSSSGAVFIDGDRVDASSVDVRVRAFLSRTPDASIVIVPDRSTPSGRLVEILDVAKLAGARRLAVAAEEPEKVERR
jgi:biopolymer transport protein ExbD